MHLKVPQINQTLGSPECGVACLDMIIQYHFPFLGSSYEKIKQEISFYSGGLSSFTMAKFLQQFSYNNENNEGFLNGFEVELVYLHPFVFNLGTKNQEFSTQDLIDHLQTACQKNLPTGWNNSLPDLIDFLQLGGKLTIDYPKKSHIEAALKQKLPIITMLSSMALGKRTFENYKARGAESTFYNSHFNVTVGLENQRIFVNDPDWLELDFQKAGELGGYELGGRQNHNIDDFLWTIYANIGQDIDNGSLIIAKPVSERRV